jgi:hypothetical protein
VCCFFFSFFFNHSNNTKPPTITVHARHPILLTHTDIHQTYSRRH